MSVAMLTPPLKVAPEHDWAIEFAEMLQDCEKQLVALHERAGVRVTASPTGPLPTG